MGLRKWRWTRSSVRVRVKFSFRSFSESFTYLAAYTSTGIPGSPNSIASHGTVHQDQNGGYMLSFTGMEDGFEPYQTYDVRISHSDSSRNFEGFMVVPLEQQPGSAGYQKRMYDTTYSRSITCAIGTGVNHNQNVSSLSTGGMQVATWTAPPDLSSVTFRTTVYDFDTSRPGDSYIFTTTVYRKNPFAVAASLSKYPDYSGSIEAKGAVVVSQVQTCDAVNSSTGGCDTLTETVRLTYHIEGLELSVSGGVHVRRMLHLSWKKKKRVTLENFLDNRYMREHHVTTICFITTVEVIRGATQQIQFGPAIPLESHQDHSMWILVTTQKIRTEES